MLRWTLKDIAEPQRWNPRKLALAADLHYNTVYLIWNDKSTRLDLTTLDKLAKVLNVKPCDLIGEKEG